METKLISPCPGHIFSPFRQVCNICGVSLFRMAGGWGNKTCGKPCWGILDYVYSTFWRCRTCGRWHSRA